MITAALATLFLAPMAFPGGTPGAFAQSLEKTSQKGVIISVGRIEKIPAITVDPNSRDSFAYTINKKTPLTLRAGIDMAFSDEIEQEGIFHDLTTSPEPVPNPNLNLPDDYLKDGYVTIAPKNGKPYKLTTLVKAKWSKPVSAFWLYQPLFVYVQVHHMPEKTFFSLLAKSLGSALAVTDSGYQLNPDWSRITPMLSKTFNYLVKNDTSPSKEKQLQHQLFSAMFDSMPQDTVSTLFSTDGGSATYPIPSNSSFSSIAADYLQKMGDAEANQEKRGSRTAIGILNKIDPRVPVEYHVTVSGQAYLKVPVITPSRGRIRFSRSRYVNI